MKLSIYENGGNTDGSFEMPGGVLTGPLVLSGTVNSPLEAVHKQYIDTACSNLNASNITTGTLSSARMPAFTGEGISTAGSTNITLSETGVISGDYSKVTVNTKGQVTAGGSLVESDIPGFSWNKITNGKPTTLSGYGIVDALGSGGTVTGYLTLASDPVDGVDAVTKQYVDNNLGGGSGLVAGDIVNYASYSSVPGFLRCNGGEVSKTEYSALYSVVGDQFSYFTIPGAGQPWRQQYDINTEQTGDITGWTAGTNLSSALSHSTVAVTKNRVYLISGTTANGIYTTNCYTAPINSDGTIGTWTTSGVLLGALANSEALVIKNKIYVFGGSNGGWSQSVQTASINSDGTIGSWTTSQSLPSPLTGNRCAFVTKNRLYLLGQSGHFYYNTINTDGTLNGWVTVTANETAFGIPVSDHSCCVIRNRLYVFNMTTVYSCPINTDGSISLTWRTELSLPASITGCKFIVFNKAIYILTGIISGVATTNVYRGEINTDGTIASWTQISSFSQQRSAAQVIVTKNKIYVLGGRTSSASTTTNTTYYAPILGGLNDYSPYYDGSILPTDPNNFRLPDYTNYESTGFYFFIKS